MSLDRLTFLTLIRDVLRKHPDWSQDAMSAVMSGMYGALSEAEGRIAIQRQALTASLILISKHRLDAEMLNTLRQQVAAGIDPQNASKLEQDFLATLMTDQKKGDEPP
jgi:hypothetical protein